MVDIRHGRYYITRSGERVGPAKVDGTYVKFPQKPWMYRTAAAPYAGWKVFPTQEGIPHPDDIMKESN